MEKMFMARLLAACASALAGGAVAAQGATRPNMAVFPADDAGWGDYSHNGNTPVRTPAIDSLVREGVVLFSPQRPLGHRGLEHAYPSGPQCPLAQRVVKICQENKPKRSADNFRRSGYPFPNLGLSIRYA